MQSWYVLRIFPDKKPLTPAALEQYVYDYFSPEDLTITVRADALRDESAYLIATLVVDEMEDADINLYYMVKDHVVDYAILAEEEYPYD